MKKFVLFLCTTFILNFPFSTANAASDNTSEKRENIYPVKYICESLGGDIFWKPELKTAVIKYNDNTLELKVGSNIITSNGTEKTLEDEIIISGGRTQLPLSVINSELGVDISEQDCLTIIGKQFINLLMNDSIDEASTLLSRTFSNYINQEYLKSLAENVTALELQDQKVEFWTNTLHKSVGIPFKEVQNIWYTIKFNSEGKIDELGFQGKQPEPAPEPKYIAKVSFSEKEVTFGSSPWQLPGTLTLPEGNGPFPVVILVQDTGPTDRDGTTGSIKPFRDLAAGLAANNIAVLRYDKRSLVHSTKMQLVANVTLNEEIEQDVYRAAEYLKSVDEIDITKIIVLGHGLGGYALPRILTTAGDTFKAGIIINGISRPQYETFTEYYQYLQEKGYSSREQVEYVTEQVNLLKSEGFDPKNPPDSYIMGNEFYFSDMKSYDVMGMAERLTQPFLVMQGQRDFLVKSDIDYTNWQKAFGQNINSDFKLYPRLNHLLTDCEGESTPREYYDKANIPQYVIDHIIDFINKLE